jgi:transcriptional regulator with XRE-family HTH domain
MKSIYLELGENIRAKRLQSGLTLEELGELANLHPSYIGQIERSSKKASLETVAALARALGVTTGLLLTGKSSVKGLTLSDQLRPLLRAHSGAKRRVLLEVIRQLSKSLRKLG